MSQRTLPKIRLASQVLFFGLFLFLLFRTEFHGSFGTAGSAVRIPWPVGLFLEANPLVAAANALSTHALYRNLLWSLAILVPTFFLGRAFCGWVCPLGTLNHYFGHLRSERKRGGRLLESNRYKRWQTAKYYILVAVLVAAAAGTALVGIVDPIALTVRSLTLSVLPAISYALNAVMDGLYASGLGPLKLVADVLQFLLQSTLVSFKQPYFRQAVVVGVLFILILGLNFRVTRFWCRALCPLGALLGACSRWTLLGLVQDPSECDSRNRCLQHCQGGDDPIPGPPWRKAECHLCFNCVGECPTSGITFRFLAPPATTISVPQLQRRKLLTGIAAGAGLLPLMRSTTGLAVEQDARLVRPPGSLDEARFLERCIRCGACMKVCPNNALHPSLAEGGLEALWTPVLVPRVGYCEPNCVLCSQVCPTGAIWEITEQEKLGRPAVKQTDGTETPAIDPIRIGTAFYDRGRCLPWAMATECIVCEEWCPTSPKAIFLLPAEAIDSLGTTKTVRQPYVDAHRCIGCGACEYACPVRDRPAVYVTSVGETRSKTNQFLLQRAPRRIR
ncbi:MAG: 4Fe-4S binding protein [Acidobacteria bacterium]|nr:4Fe-4S binding protein [Acidobacteriota bacterium]